MLKLPRLAAKAAVAATPTPTYAKGAFVPSAEAEPRVLSQWMVHDQARARALPPAPPRVAFSIPAKPIPQWRRYQVGSTKGRKVMFDGEAAVTIVCHVDFLSSAHKNGGRSDEE